MKKCAHPLVKGQRTRANDAWGSGAYGASRKGHKHQGLDIVATPLQAIFAPFSGKITRKAYPYADDLSYTGLVLEGSGEWSGFSAKIFYVKVTASGEVEAGDQLGLAQNLTTKYPGITNHVHIEIRKLNRLINPFEVWKMCF